MAAASKKARASAPAKSSRAVAADILHAVETRRGFADILLDPALQTNHLFTADPGPATAIVYGTLRWRGRIDWALGLLTHKPLEDMDAYIRNVLRMTLYQILFLDRVPAYAAVNEAVELEKRYGGRTAAGLVNAVARGVLRERDRLVKLYSDGDH